MPGRCMHQHLVRNCARSSAECMHVCLALHRASCSPGCATNQAVHALHQRVSVFAVFVIACVCCTTAHGRARPVSCMPCVYCLEGRADSCT